MKHVDTPSVRQRLCAFVVSGTLVASTAAAPMTAFAVESSAGDQVGTGVTDVTVQLIDAAGEHGGTVDDLNNPDNDVPKDGLGDNIAFTVPSAINFVAKADGTLIGPDPDSTYIENRSVFSIHASSMEVDAETGWTIVKDVKAQSAQAPNSVDFKFGPDADQLDASDYLTKTAVADPSKWNMGYSKDSGDDFSDRVKLRTSGHIARIDKEIKEQTKIATMHTYVTPGEAGA